MSGLHANNKMTITTGGATAHHNFVCAADQLRRYASASSTTFIARVPVKSMPMRMDARVCACVGNCHLSREIYFQVRGGPRDALIVHATQPTGSLLYQEAFLVTYRSFVSSKELIQKLIRR